METIQSPVKLTPDITLSHLISVDPKAAEMLVSIGLDPAKHKEETLQSVCKERQWSEIEVLQWIKKHRTVHSESGNDVYQEPHFGNDVVKWCSYVEENLHAATLEFLNEISRDFPRVRQVHGNQYPWLKNMKWHFETFDEALRFYLAFEKRKFFKLIRKWKNQKGHTLDGTIREMDRCITIVRQDQERLQNYMDTLHEKAHGFKNSDGACTTLRILNQNFKMLYSGLEKQFRVEQKILLPLLQRKLDTS